MGFSPHATSPSFAHPVVLLPSAASCMPSGGFLLFEELRKAWLLEPVGGGGRSKPKWLDRSPLPSLGIDRKPHLAAHVPTQRGEHSLESLSFPILHSRCGDLLFFFIIAFLSLTTEKVGIPAQLCARSLPSPDKPHHSAWFECGFLSLSFSQSRSGWFSPLSFSFFILVTTHL